MSYDDFRDKIKTALSEAEGGLSWTEVRTATGLPQMFPNNQWVRRLEKDIGLQRAREKQGIIRWSLRGSRRKA
jgi:hypothetical protein